MIKSIKLVNIKKHANLEIDFDAGVNVIVGPNYSGKSSLLQGVLFGMFGIRAVPGNLDDFWTDETESSSVDLVFAVAGKEVLIHRTRTSATLYEDGKKTATGTSTVNGKIADLMGISMADFLMVKYSRQKETANLLTFGAANLSGLIERVGGISLVKKALIQLNSVISTSKGVLSVKEESPLPPLKAAVRDAEAELSKGMAESKELESVVSGLSGEYSEAKTAHKKAADALELLRLHQANLSNAETKVNSLVSQRTSIQSDLDALDPVPESYADKLAEEADALTVELTGMASTAHKQNRLERKRDSYKDSIKLISEDLKKHTAELADLEAGDTEAAVTELERASTSRERALGALKNLKTKLESGACSECGRPFEGGWDKAALEAEVQEAEKAHTEAGYAWQRCQDSVTETKRVIRSMEKLEKKKALLEVGLRSDEQVLAMCVEQLDELPPTASSDIPEMENKLTALRTQEKKIRAVLQEEKSFLTQLMTVNSSITEAMQEVTLTRNQAPADLLVTKEKVGTLNDYLDRVTDRHHAAELALSDHQHTCSGLGRELDDAKFYLQQAEEDNVVAKTHEKRLSDASELKKFLSDNREAFMQHTWDRLLSQASLMCSHATGGALTSMQRDNDVFRYTEEGVVRALASASGGQESLMGLSLKVALSESIPDSLSCLLLDEVTADLDEPHSSAVTSLLGNVGCQIITVSHRDMDRSGQFNVIDMGASMAG